MGKAKTQTRRVKQEAINNSLLLLDPSESGSSTAPGSLNSFNLEPGLLPSSSNGTLASALNPIKQEDSEEKQILQARWEPLKARLWELWRKKPAVPSLKSRTAWAKLQGIPGHKVHSWYSNRKQDRKKEGIQPHSEDGYDLTAYEQPAADSEGVVKTPVMASSSVPPSSPPRTPVRLASEPGHVEIANYSPSLGLDRGSPIVLKRPQTLEKSGTLPISRFIDPTGREAPASNVQVIADAASDPKVGHPIPNGAKRGRKRKVRTEEINPTSEGQGGTFAQPAPKKKRQRAIKPKPADIAPSLTAKMCTDNKPETNLYLAPGTPTNHSVPPHSAVAKIYTSVLVAPFVLGKDIDQNATLSTVPSFNEFVPVQEQLIANPSPYITQPLPPLPAFEALGGGSFINDCRNALRTSLKINSELGLWDLVVEGLPPNYFMDIGKDLDIEWPESD